MNTAMSAARSRPPTPSSLSQSARHLCRNLARIPLHIAESESEHKPAIEYIGVVAGHIAQPVQIAAMSHRSVELNDHAIGLVVIHVLVFGPSGPPNQVLPGATWQAMRDRKSTRLNSSHLGISYAVFCLKKK